MRTPDRSDRLSRVVLTVLGLVLLGVGVYGLLRGYEVFGANQADEPLLTEGILDFMADNREWFWPVATLLALAVAYLAFRWFLSLLRTTASVDEIDLTRDPDAGTVSLDGTGAANAVADDVEGYRGVESATARLVSDGARPEVYLRVEVADNADIERIRRRIEEHALTRLARALEVDAVMAHLRVDLAEPTGRVLR
jgi:hypothetical protein